MIYYWPLVLLGFVSLNYGERATFIDSFQQGRLCYVRISH